MIPFNIPPYIPECDEALHQAIASRKICGDGAFTGNCSRLLETLSGTSRALLTTSCSSALDMSALLLNLGPEDEVILPSFTFVSTANAFALRGAKLVFVDVDPDTMNLDPACVEAAITPRTRALVPVHYAGISCDMDRLNALAKKHSLYVVEDAAQAVTSTYKGKPCGGLSDIGCFSFHETKNFSMGEGGAILIDNPALAERAEIVREKGTDRSRFHRGQVDKYTWVDIGSSFLPSELNAAYLYPQLVHHQRITEARMARWNQYHQGLASLARENRIQQMTVPEGCTHNAHMYYIMCSSLEERTSLISWLKERDILAVFHYIPLHSAKAGLKFGRFHGTDQHTTSGSDRLLRLPLYYELQETECSRVIDAVHAFYRQ